MDSFSAEIACANRSCDFEHPAPIRDFLIREFGAVAVGYDDGFHKSDCNTRLTS